MHKSLIPIAAVFLALTFAAPANACSWLNQAYFVAPGAYAAGHGASQEAVNPVTFDRYLGVDVVDDHSAHVYVVLCIDRPGTDPSTCSAADGDIELTGVDRIETTVNEPHGAAHVFLAAMHVADDGSAQVASTGRVYSYFTSDCAGNPPRVGGALPTLL